MSEAAGLPARPVPASYGAMLRFLFAGSGIWAMLIVVLTAVTYKTVWGSWGWLDVLVIGAFCFLRGLIEWGIHVYLYHARPLPLIGVCLVSSVADAHTKHHADPDDLSTLLITYRGVLAVLVTVFVGCLALLRSVDLAMSFVAGFALVGLVIEVVHLICHSQIPHRSSFMRRIVLLHRHHHHVDSANYYGVSSSLGDRLFGTFPSPRESSGS